MLKTVTSLTNGAVATILTPGPNCRMWCIQNTGAGAVNLSYDGGSTYTMPTTQGTPNATAKVGTDPTTTAAGLGYQLAAGAQLLVTADTGGNSLRLPIRAILQTATTTTLQISADDLNSA
jgi:hypothetical protein